jgi:hypothetical protein
MKDTLIPKFMNTTTLFPQNAVTFLNTFVEPFDALNPVYPLRTNSSFHYLQHYPFWGVQFTYVKYVRSEHSREAVSEHSTLFGLSEKQSSHLYGFQSINEDVHSWSLKR